MNPRRILLITFFAVTTIITAADLKQGSLPKPARFLGAVTVWSMLSIMAEFGADLLAVGFSVGFTIALIYKYYGGQLTGSRQDGTTNDKGVVPGRTTARTNVNDRGTVPGRAN